MAKRKRLLIIIGSRRRRGNTELLAKVIAGHLARHHEVEVELLRLTDFAIRACKGCLRCIVGRTRCVLDDDAGLVHQAMEAADGIVFCMPVYEFSPPAAFKLLLDRQYSTVTYRNFHHKRVALIAVGTMKQQGPFVQALFDLYLKAMLLQPVGSLVIGDAHGPGSILADRRAVEAALELAGTLVEKLDQDLPNACPLCAAEIVSLRGGQVSCPLCGRRGALADGRVVWDASAEALSFDSHQMARLFGPGAWASSTIARYKQQLGAILEEKRRYELRDSAFTWRRPPGAERAAGAVRTGAPATIDGE